MLLFLFFFFKQKTAYEMRISDWSSDVCSSDLRGRELLARQVHRVAVGAHHVVLDADAAVGAEGVDARPVDGVGVAVLLELLEQHVDHVDARLDGHHHARLQHARQAQERMSLGRLDPAAGVRSEEHTSELQSLMRNSYAV